MKRNTTILIAGELPAVSTACAACTVCYMCCEIPTSGAHTSAVNIIIMYGKSCDRATSHGGSCRHGCCWAAGSPGVLVSASLTLCCAVLWYAVLWYFLLCSRATGASIRWAGRQGVYGCCLEQSVHAGLAASMWLYCIRSSQTCVDWGGEVGVVGEVAFDGVMAIHMFECPFKLMICLTAPSTIDV